MVRGIPGPHMVVVPLTTLGNWAKEFKMWVPDVKILIFHGNKEERVPFLCSRSSQQPRRIL